MNGMHFSCRIGQSRWGLIFRSTRSPKNVPYSNWRPLSSIEAEAIARLLSQDFPGRKELLTQATELEARTLDAEGGIALRTSEGMPAAQVVNRVPVMAEFEDSNGVTVHVLLHVINGFLNELEIYQEGLAPIAGGMRPSDFRLFVRDPA